MWNQRSTGTGTQRGFPAACHDAVGGRSIFSPPAEIPTQLLSLTAWFMPWDLWSWKMIIEELCVLLHLDQFSQARGQIPSSLPALWLCSCCASSSIVWKLQIRGFRGPKERSRCRCDLSPAVTLLGDAAGIGGQIQQSTSGNKLFKMKIGANLLKFHLNLLDV